MAADTPVVVAPDGESGIRLDSTLMALKTPYSGAGTQSEVHWRVGAESGMTTILWETLLRENDDHWLGDDWVEIPLALIALCHVRELHDRGCRRHIRPVEGCAGMRFGTYEGVDADTQLWAPFWNGDTADKSGQTVTVSDETTGGQVPQPVRGYFGDALDFTPANATHHPRLDYDGAGLEISGDLTVECWVRIDDDGSNTGGTPVSMLNESGGSDNDFFFLRATGTLYQFRVWDSGATAYFVSVDGRHYTARLGGSRWMHLRGVLDVSTGLSLFLNGQLVGYEPFAAPITMAATGFPDIQVGGANSDSQGTLDFVGYIADVKVRDVIDTDPDTCSPSVAPARLTSRQLQAVEVDLREYLEGRSWTTDGGAFYVAASTINLSIVTRDDIVSVVETTSGTATTYTETGTVADVKAGSDNWFWDDVNLRLYSSEDPTAADSFVVTVRQRWADRGMQRGPAYYTPAVISTDPGERRMNYWDREYPVGGGGQLVVASQALVAGITSEEATDIGWTNAAYTVRMLSDGMPWSERIPLAEGIIDAQPQDDGNRIQARLLQRAAKLHRVQMEDEAIDRETYPRAWDGHDGHRFPFVIGHKHRQLPAVCVDMDPGKTVSGADYRLWQVTNHPIGYLRLSSGGAAMVDVDLDAGTFHLHTSYHPQFTNVVVDVGGFGASASPTSTASTFVAEHGDEDDVYTSPNDILQNVLTRVVNESSFGTTWTGTDGRVAVWLRYVEEFGAGIADWVARFLTESQTFLYYDLAAEAWEWEDVVKADAVDRVLRDGDIIQERFPPDPSRLAKEMRVKTMAYLTKDGTPTAVGSDSLLELDVSAKYDARESWRPIGEPAGFHTRATAAAWLARNRSHVETPPVFHEIVAGARWTDIEQMDVIDNQSSRRPSGAGNRYRVMSTHPMTTGQTKMLLFAETPFAADGTSANALREGLSPLYQVRWGYSSGRSLSASQTGVEIADDALFAYPGAWITPRVTGVADRWCVYAQRVGGAANSDLVIELYDLDNSNTLATAEIGTSAGFYTDTTLTSIPSTNARLEIRYTSAAGVTGTVWACSWVTDEDDTNALSSPITPHLIDAYGTATGQAETATGVISSARALKLPIQTSAAAVRYDRLRVLWHFDATSATGCTLELQGHMERPSEGADPWASGEAVGLTGTLDGTSGFAVVDIDDVADLQKWPYMPYVRISSGTMTFNAVSVYALVPYEEVAT
jgi:hypothetical protein